MGSRRSVPLLHIAAPRPQQHPGPTRLQVEQPVWVKFDKGKKKGLSEGFHRHELAQLEIRVSKAGDPAKVGC